MAKAKNIIVIASSDSKRSQAIMSDLAQRDDIELKLFATANEGLDFISKQVGSYTGKELQNIKAIIIDGANSDIDDDTAKKIQNLEILGSGVSSLLISSDLEQELRFNHIVSHSYSDEDFSSMLQSINRFLDKKLGAKPSQER